MSNDLYVAIKGFSDLSCSTIETVMLKCVSVDGHHALSVCDVDKYKRGIVANIQFADIADCTVQPIDDKAAWNLFMGVNTIISVSVYEAENRIVLLSSDYLQFNVADFAGANIIGVDVRLS